jgi:hypothetical protein
MFIHGAGFCHLKAFRLAPDEQPTLGEEQRDENYIRLMLGDPTAWESGVARKICLLWDASFWTVFHHEIGNC